MTTGEYNQSVHEHSNGLYRFIYKQLKRKEDAENTVQDAFENLWINRDKVLYSKAKSWLFTTAYNKMIDGIRKQSKIVAMEDYHEHINPTSDRVQVDLRAQIDRALERLSEVQQSVIMLRDYEGYDYKEISEITGLSEAQVKVNIFRGRQKMKEYLVSIEAVV